MSDIIRQYGLYYYNCTHFVYNFMILTGFVTLYESNLHILRINIHIFLQCTYVLFDIIYHYNYCCTVQKSQQVQLKIVS